MWSLRLREEKYAGGMVGGRTLHHPWAALLGRLDLFGTNSEASECLLLFLCIFIVF